MVQLVPAMMEVASTKEPPIADLAAIRILKQRMVKEPIFEAASSRTEKSPATAMGTTRDWSLRSGFVHGKTLCPDAYTTNNEESGSARTSCKAVPFCTLRRLPPKRC
jgi:hypothetical protein